MHRKLHSAKRIASLRWVVIFNQHFFLACLLSTVLSKSHSLYYYKAHLHQQHLILNKTIYQTQQIYIFAQPFKHPSILFSLLLLLIYLQQLITDNKMHNLTKNGSYVERRKMYIGYPLHNMKSKVPIEWSEQDQTTYQKNRRLAKEIMEKQYIKNAYNQKMERIINNRYRPNYEQYNSISNQSQINPQNDVLMKEVEQFNTSKIMSSPLSKPNPQILQKIPYPKNIDSQQNQSQSRYQQNRQSSTNSERKDKNYNVRPDKYEYQSNERGNYYNGQKMNVNRSYNERQRMPEQPRYENQRYQSNQKPYNLYREGSYQRSQGQLSRESRNNRQDLSPKNYYALPYQNNYNAKLREYRRLAQFPYQEKPQHPYHPFRNNLPDRLQQFLRQKTKADRKSAMNINLVVRQKSF